MTLEPKIALRLQFLARVVRKECQHLTSTDQRLFKSMFTLEQATRLEADPDLAERLSSGIAALLVGMSRVQFLGELHRYEVAVIALDDDELA